MSLLQRFLQANRRLSARFDRRDDAALYARYDAYVGRAIGALSDGGIVADVGGGRHCSFAELLPTVHALTIVAVDQSAEELAANSTVDRTMVADVSRDIPFANGEVDLLVSRTLLEHVPDVQGAARAMARVLKPGAETIHLLPCRYALFAIVARVVPFGVAKRLLHFAIPESKGVVEFDVVYDRGHPRALEQVFAAAGFREVSVECTWDQAAYFHSLFPVFLLVLLYQRLAALCRVRVLASYAIVRAVR
jgi:ubiquinone/menaquinone biosynthesis C-methylase UbiE